MITCSVLIPTRKRLPELLLAVGSILRTTTPGNVEVICGFDDDDETFSGFRSTCVNEKDFLNVWAFQWPRQAEGYKALSRYYDWLADRASGRWLLIFNDDAEIEGKGWDLQLADMPSQGVIAFPEFHHLGASHYRTDPLTYCPFLAVPIGCAKPTFPDPIDRGLHSRFVTEQGWRTQLLRGITIKHNRKVDETLPKERY